MAYSETTDELAEYYRERCQRLEAFVRQLSHGAAIEVALRAQDLMRDLGIEETKG